MPRKPPHNSITLRQHHLAWVKFFSVLMYWHAFFSYMEHKWLLNELPITYFKSTVTFGSNKWMCILFAKWCVFPVLLACYTPNTLSLWYKASVRPHPRETVKLMAFLWLQHNTWFTACTKFSVWKIRLRFTSELAPGISCTRLCRNRWQI